MNKNIKEMIQRRATTEQIRKQAIKTVWLNLWKLERKSFNGDYFGCGVVSNHF